MLRRRKRAPLRVGRSEEDDRTVEDAPDPGPGVEDLVERGERAGELATALEGLSEEHRRVLALRYTLDLPYAEMAEALGVPESTVTMRLYHAKKALRRRLGEAA